MNKEIMKEVDQVAADLERLLAVRPKVMIRMDGFTRRIADIV